MGIFSYVYENNQKAPQKTSIRYYISELTSILFELDKRYKNNDMTDYEARTVYNLLNTWVMVRNKEIEEDAERKTEGEQE